jgi:uncharacterized phage protein (TIGR02218 family)
VKTFASEALKTHMAEEVTTIAACWTITRKDGQVFCFTDHDTDLYRAGRNYLAASSMAASDIKQDRTLSVDNMEAIAFLDSESITEEDLRAGLFDDASVDLFLCNYEDPTQYELYILKDWLLGRVEIRDNSCTVELRGLGQRLSRKIGDLYSETCRAKFGDAHCGLDLEALVECREIGSVESVTDRQRFICADPGLTAGDGRYAGGILTWTGPSSSPNYLAEIEVKAVVDATKEVTLFIPMPYDIEVGDEFEMQRGCDKTFRTCVGEFDNGINFRGEPWVPPEGKVRIWSKRDRTPWWVNV